MKTTLELPDRLLREAKATAAARGQTLRDFVGDAIADRLRFVHGGGDKPWLRHRGALRAHSGEIDALDDLIAEEFETVDPTDWQ